MKAFSVPVKVSAYPLDVDGLLNSLPEPIVKSQIMRYRYIEIRCKKNASYNRDSS